MSPRSTSPELARVLQSAARLQQLVPDAVLVGGTAAAWHAGHRISFDHDHVLADLTQRFDAVLGALEADPEFVLNRAAHSKIIPGELGGIETGVRQLIRTVPLTTERLTLPSGQTLVVPTIAEALRIKAYLALKRNQTQDYLDNSSGRSWHARGATRYVGQPAEHLAQWQGDARCGPARPG